MTAARSVFCLWAAAGLLAAAPASAQGLIAEQRLAAGLANEAVGEAVTACAKNGYAVTAIVVDIDGDPSTTASLGNLPNVTFTPGGVTIMAAGKPIGGIGVGGAPGGNFDDECARAALDKIKDRMK